MTIIIWHTTLLHRLKNQLDKSHLHAKIIFVPYQENKNIGYCATLLNYFLTISTFLPLKALHIWISIFNTVTLVFSFSEQSEAEKIEKNIQVNGRGLFACRITPQSLPILNKWIWIVRLSQLKGKIDMKVPFPAPLPIVPLHPNSFTGFLFCRFRGSLSSTRHLP